MGPQFKFKAAYDFAAQQSGDLGFAQGDIIVATMCDKSSQWWEGYLESDPSVTGSFPHNYVEPLLVLPDTSEQKFTAAAPGNVKPLQTQVPSSLGHAASLPRFRASYDFVSVQNGDLSFVKGDIIVAT